MEDHILLVFVEVCVALPEHYMDLKQSKPLVQLSVKVRNIEVREKREGDLFSYVDSVR